ncbi:MAG: hypothetical protein ACFFCM_03115 [Promethearchaeota archaeon]
MEEVEEYNPKLGLLGSVILSICLFYFLIFLRSINDILLINSWTFLLIATGIIFIGDYFLQIYREDKKRFSLNVFIYSVVAGLFFIFYFFYKYLGNESASFSYEDQLIKFILWIYIVSQQKYDYLGFFNLYYEPRGLNFLINSLFWEIQFILFVIFFCLIGSHFIYYRNNMKNRKLSIGTGIISLVVATIVLIYYNLYFISIITEEYNFSYLLTNSIFHFSNVKFFSYSPLIFITILVGIVLYRQTRIRTVIPTPTAKFPLFSIIYVVIGVGLLIPGIPFLFFSLLLITRNMLVCLGYVSFWMFFVVVPGIYLVLEFVKILNDYTEVQDLILDEVDEAISQKSPDQTIVKEKEVKNIEKIETYESTEHIDQYNDPNHKYYIAINSSIEKVDNYLKMHPNYPIEDQLRMAELKPLERSCPDCNDYLFLYKKFLIYCANCEKFFYELISK